METDELGRGPMASLRDHAQGVADEIDKWGNAADPHIAALIYVAENALRSQTAKQRHDMAEENS